MTFSPLLPAWLILLAVAIAVAAGLRAYRRPSWPAALRLLAVAIVAVLLANPVRVAPKHEGRLPRLAVVADVSASMAVGDVPGGTRLEHAARALAAVEAAAAGRFRVERWTLGERLASGAPVAAGGGTAFDDLARLAQPGAGDEGPPAAVVLASDGGDRGANAPDDALAAAGVPVFALAVGGSAPAANAALRLEAASPTAFPGQDLEIVAVVGASGTAVGASSELIVSDEAGAEVLKTTIALAAEVRVPLTVAVGAQAGERLWRARLAPIGGEASADDNAAAVAVQVVDRALRLAVVEGQPYWDTSFAVRSWRRDRQLAVAAVYRVGGKRLRAAGDGETVPEKLDAAALAKLDLVVLGARADEVLDEAQATALAAWVDGGGGLLLLGPHAGLSGPLAGLDPLLRRQGRRSGVTPVLAAAGRSLALLPSTPGSGALAPVAAGLVAGLRPRTDVLIGDEALPLVVQRRHGGGQVAAVNAEGVWRWSLDEKADGEAAARFWRQLAKALVRDAGAGLRADRPRYRAGQEAAIVAASGDNAPPVTVEAPGAVAAPLSVPTAGTRLALDRPGLWTLRQGAQRLSLVVDADVREVVDTARRDDRLARLAGATGGAVVEAGDAAALGTRLARRADLNILAPAAEPLVTRAWWLLALVAALGGEWWLRRRRFGAV